MGPGAIMGICGARYHAMKDARIFVPVCRRVCDWLEDCKNENHVRTKTVENVLRQRAPTTQI